MSALEGSLEWLRARREGSSVEGGGVVMSGSGVGRGGAAGGGGGGMEEGRSVAGQVLMEMGGLCCEFVQSRGPGQSIVK